MTKQIYYILSFILLISTNSVAQSNNLWLRTTFSIKDSLGIKYDVELQHRLQNSKSDELPKQNFLNSARVWMHYSPNEQLKISLSPLATFDHIQYKDEDQPALKHHVMEYRNSLATEFQFVQQKTFTFYARTAIEGRFFSNREDQFRWRNRVGIDIKLTNKTTLKPFYEIFHQISKGKPLTLDQMRFNTSVKHQFFKIMSAEMGYLRLLKPNRNSGNLLGDNNLYFNLQYHF